MILLLLSSLQRSKHAVMTSASFLLDPNFSSICNAAHRFAMAGAENSATSPTEKQYQKEDGLWNAMQIADVIRRHEIDAQLHRNAEEAKNSPITPQQEPFDPLQPLRSILETPGVQQACFATALGIAVALPTRRYIMRVADRNWKLGTIFPDLVVTPMLAITVAQCALWTGSVYGSAAYLHRLADIANATGTSQSATLDSICNDPIVLSTAHWEKEPFANVVHTKSDVRSWDPRYATLRGLERTLKACRERREHQSRND
jgi:hypothetical protein